MSEYKIEKIDSPERTWTYMKICYLTTLAPCGEGETFVLREIEAVLRSGNSVTVIPTRPKYDYNGERFNVYFLKAFEPETIKRAFHIFLKKPIKILRACISMIFHANGAKKALKNSYFFIKALAVADYIIECGDFDFIHAHWLATTSTVGYIVSAITGIPWGATGHRFDVYENNAIRKKAITASFIRIIDENGYRYVKNIVGENEKDKVIKLYLGIDNVNIDDTKMGFIKKDKYRVVVPANLIEVKGHTYAIEAFLELKRRGITNVECCFYGNGELKDSFTRQIEEKEIRDMVRLGGYIKNSDLLKQYKNKQVDIVLLPSIKLSESEHEGIPVCLMEAMSYGIPVISTNTGGIPELLKDHCGMIIPDKSASAIADAIVELILNRDRYNELSINGYNRVVDCFNNDRNTGEILNLIKEAVKKTQ